jgi:hypothetical protein
MKTVTNCVIYPESQWSITQEFPDAASNNMNEFLKVTALHHFIYSFQRFSEKSIHTGIFPKLFCDGSSG